MMSVLWAPVVGLAIFAMGVGLGLHFAPMMPVGGPASGAASSTQGVELHRSLKPVSSAVIEALRQELYAGSDPYGLLAMECCLPGPDLKAARGTLSMRVVQKVLDVVGEPGLWLEIGSYIGSSAIKTAQEIKSRNLSTGILCVDPFVGDWAMWEQHKSQVLEGKWDWLRADASGVPRIYSTFLANVREAGHGDIVLPLPATGTIGTKVVMRLVQLGRLRALPQVIYLDSAHEPEETLVELRRAWIAMAEGGVLFGDDYDEVAEVRNDVNTFSKLLSLRALSKKELKRWSTSGHRASQPIPGLVVVESHWLLHKRA